MRRYLIKESYFRIKVLRLLIGYSADCHAIGHALLSCVACLFKAFLLIIQKELFMLSNDGIRYGYHLKVVNSISFPTFLMVLPFPSCEISCSM